MQTSRQYVYPAWSCYLSHDYQRMCAKKFIDSAYFVNNKAQVVGKNLFVARAPIDSKRKQTVKNIDKSGLSTGWINELMCIPTPCNQCGKSQPEPMITCTDCRAIVFCSPICRSRFVTFTDHYHYCNQLSKLVDNNVDKRSFLFILGGITDIPSYEVNMTKLKRYAENAPSTDNPFEVGICDSMWPKMHKLAPKDIINVILAHLYIRGLRNDDIVDLDKFSPITLKDDVFDRNTACFSTKLPSSDRAAFLKMRNVTHRGCLGYRFTYQMDMFAVYAYYYALLRVPTEELERMVQIIEDNAGLK